MERKKKTVRLTESALRKMIREGVRMAINEAEDGGWVVESEEAKEAYEFACEIMGKENLDSDIVQSLSSDELARSLAFIFRMNDFREWYDHKEGDHE